MPRIAGPDLVELAGTLIRIPSPSRSEVAMADLIAAQECYAAIIASANQVPSG